MAYHRSDSSGTDDDHPPPPHVNRPSGGSQVGRNGRASEGMLMYGRNDSDLESQIHLMEKEAYSAVVRAFIAQSDTFSWDKEGLISELRKELRVSDVEHRTILGSVNSDGVVKQIREYRQNLSNPHISISNSGRSIFDNHAPIMSSSSKRQKGVSSISSLPPPAISRAHGLPGIAGKGAVSRTSKERFPRENWNDNGGHDEFAQGEANYGEKGARFLPSNKGRTTSNGQKPSVRVSSQNLVHSKKPVSLELRNTEKLLEKVEQIFGNAHSDPSERERAKATLKEHEQALVDAIFQLGEMTEDGHPLKAKKGRMQNNRKGNVNQGSIYNEGCRRIISDRQPIPAEDGGAYDDQHDTEGDV